MRMKSTQLWGGGFDDDMIGGSNVPDVFERTPAGMTIRWRGSLLCGRDWCNQLLPLGILKLDNAIVFTVIWKKFAKRLPKPRLFYITGWRGNWNRFGYIAFLHPMKGGFNSCSWTSFGVILHQPHPIRIWGVAVIAHIVSDQSLAHKRKS